MPVDNEDEKHEARRKPLPGYHTLFGVQPPHAQSDGAGFVSRPSVNCHQSSGRDLQCRLESQSYKNGDGMPSPNDPKLSHADGRQGSDSTGGIQ